MIRAEEIKATVSESADGEISCSIDETNRIRVLLGLKPLNVDITQSQDYAAMQNMKKKIEEEQKLIEASDLLNRLDKAKNKRLLNSKVTGKTLSVAEDPEDLSLLSAADWVKRSREKQILGQDKAKELAKKQEKDEDEKSKIHYKSNDLKGLRVMHDNFEIGQDVILTLADSNILEMGVNGQLLGVREDDDDVLQNSLMAEDDQRLQREKRAKRAKRPVYSGYDDDEFGENAAFGVRPNILAHYDAEKKLGPKLVLGEGGAIIDSKGNNLNAETTTMSNSAPEHSLKMEVTMSSDFYTPAEFAVFHKPRKDKKMRKIRKKKSDDDEEGDLIASLESAAKDGALTDRGARKESVGVQGMSEDDLKKRLAYENASLAAQEKLKSSLAKMPEASYEEDDVDIAQSLSKVRRMALREKFKDDVGEDRGALEVKEIMQMQPQVNMAKPAVDADFDEIDADGRRKDGSLVFTSTTEFTTRLQARLNEVARSRTELAVRDQERRDEAQVQSEAKEADMQIDEVEDHVNEAEADNDDGGGDGAGVGFLHHQPLASGGMAATLALLKGSGDLNVKTKDRSELAGRARDQREYDPSADDLGVKLEYRDEFGRKLTQKEAFRQLSYRFHGYGPGRKKQEKRLRDMEAHSKEHTTKGALETGTMRSLTRTQEATGKAHVTIQGANSANSAALGELLAKNKVKAEKKALLQDKHK